MKKRYSLMMLILALSLPIMMLGVGCGPDIIVDPPPCITCDCANEALGKLLSDVINVTLDDPDSSFRPRDIDFSGVHNLYTQALAADANCTDAKVGLAFTGLMLFLTDANLNSFIDRVKNMTDTLDFNPARSFPDVGIGGDLAPAGIPLGIGSMGSILPDIARADRMVMAAAAGDPQISELQSNLETSLLPIIADSRAYLTEVLADPSYTFELSPQMQGNDGASPIILDHSDFRVFLATAYAAEAALHVFLARNLDLSEYGLDGARLALRQDSDFLTLKPGGHMGIAKDKILAAETQVELAVDALLAEINSGDDQTDDLIKVYERDRVDLNDLKDSLVYYRTYFDGQKQLEVTWQTGGGYWDWDWQNGDVWVDPIYDTFAVMVDIAQFFDNPMNNPKMFLPEYSITLDTFILSYEQFAADHWSRTRYWTNLDTLFGIQQGNDSAGLSWFYYYLPATDDSLFYYRLARDGWWGANQSVFGWDDLISYGGDNSQQWNWGTAHNSWRYNDLYWRGNELNIVVCYSWTANSYADWTWPDATFNGLFPEWTSDSIKTRLDLAPGEWIKADCDTLDID